MLITGLGLQGAAADSQQGRRAGGGETKHDQRQQLDPRLCEQAARQVCLRSQDSLRVDSTFTRDTGNAEEEVNTPFNAQPAQSSSAAPPLKNHTRYRFWVTATDGCLRESN